MSGHTGISHDKCAKCGKIFMRISSEFCLDCQKSDEEMFFKLKEYLDRNPEKSITEVSDVTGVPIKRIIKYFEEGRIRMTTGLFEENLLRCVRCDAPITIGSMCENCRILYNQGVQDLMNESARNKKGSGMHSRKADDRRRR